MSNNRAARNRNRHPGIETMIRLTSAQDSIPARTLSGDDVHRKLADEPTDKGFSLIEFLMAVFVLLIGLGGVLALFMHTMVAMTYAEESLIAKQKAREALESIFTARNTQQVPFDQVRNVGAGSTGIFLTGLLPLTTPGADGLVGTADDGTVETMVMPDGTMRTLNEFERQIEITNLTDDLRQITVTIRYAAPRGWFRNYQVSTYISRYR